MKVTFDKNKMLDFLEKKQTIQTLKILYLSTVTEKRHFTRNDIYIKIVKNLELRRYYYYLLKFHFNFNFNFISIHL